MRALQADRRRLPMLNHVVLLPRRVSRHSTKPLKRSTFHKRLLIPIGAKVEFSQGAVMKARPFKVLNSIVSAIAPFRQTQATPVQEFWKWFQKNENMLFHFEKDQQAIFNQLSVQMHKIDPNLTFEFGPDKGGWREFVLSADGIRSSFPAVEAIYAGAPSLPRWKFIPFRPRRVPMDIAIGDLTVKAETVSVQMERNGDRMDVYLSIPGYNEAEAKTYRTVGYLLLDEALGEYIVETRVGGIQIQGSLPGNGKTYKLAEMPVVFDAQFAD